MIKFLITLLIFFVLVIVLKNSSFFSKKSFYKENDFKIRECELFDEIIDRTNRDRERQCYFKCGDDDIVRVDTSIEYICQPFIVEERLLNP